MKGKYIQITQNNELSESIRVEFEKIIDKYEIKSIIFSGDSDYNSFSIHVETFQKLKKMLLNGKLFTSLHPNIILNDSNGIIKNGFEEIDCKNEQYINYYKFKNEEYFDWYIAEYYRSGYMEGYSENFINPDDGSLILELLNIDRTKLDINKHKCEQLFDDYFDNVDVLSPYLFYEFGREEGELMKAWDMILEKPLKNKLENNKKRTEENWFKVGILFATGKIDDLFIKYTSARNISRELYGENAEGYRSIISSSRSKDHSYSKSNNNIYRSYDKMSLIIEYCKKENKSITDDFIDKCNEIKPF